MTSVALTNTVTVSPSASSVPLRCHDRGDDCLTADVDAHLG
jgi:hypothetical protein